MATSRWVPSRYFLLKIYRVKLFFNILYYLLLSIFPSMYSFAFIINIYLHYIRLAYTFHLRKFLFYFYRIEKQVMIRSNISYSVNPLVCYFVFYRYIFLEISKWKHVTLLNVQLNSILIYLNELRNYSIPTMESKYAINEISWSPWSEILVA